MMRNGKGEGIGGEWSGREWKPWVGQRERKGRKKREG
jgi:hypothetical protein